MLGLGNVWPEDPLEKAEKLKTFIEKFAKDHVGIIFRLLLIVLADAVRKTKDLAGELEEQQRKHEQLKEANRLMEKELQETKLNMELAKLEGSYLQDVLQRLIDFILLFE